MTPQSAKAKGRRFQQWVAALIRASHGLEEDDCVSRPMGSNGEDIMLSPAARRAFPYAVECKNVAKSTVSTLMSQAIRHVRHVGTRPVVFIKVGSRKPFVIVDAEHFVSLTRDHADSVQSLKAATKKGKA